MKVLVVAPWLPTPTRQRSHGLIGMMAERHEVSVVAVGWSDSEIAQLDSVPGHRVRVVRGSRYRAAARAAFALARPSMSLQQAFAAEPGLRRAIEEEVEAFQPDLVYFNVARGASFIGAAGDRAVVVDLDDVRSDYYRAMGLNSTRWTQRTLGRVEAKRMASAERAIEIAADAVLVSSPVDVPADATRRRLVRSPVRALGAPPVQAPGGDRAVMVGRMCYDANVEAAVWLADKVVPRITATAPEIRLSLVGERPAAAILRRAGGSVEVTGTVASVEPYYRSAFASLVPVTMATGVQLKLVESAAIGVPIVATAIAARQAGIVDGVHCLVAEGDDQWADAILALHRDVALRERLVQAAWDWVQAAYDDREISLALLDSISFAQQRFAARDR